MVTFCRCSRMEMYHTRVHGDENATGPHQGNLSALKDKVGVVGRESGQDGQNLLSHH